MAKYLIQASYTAEGTRGVMKEGGTKRRQTVEAHVKAAGGSVEAFYFAFGDADAVVIVDLPDNATAAALSLAVNSSGLVALKTQVLLTPEEIDQASKKKDVKYRAPGKR
ncbi:MAG: GYD domain-containing protein [Acidimicrobiia bacterium]|nr:GYD domain-containing protein [Acidimicrobiia bacterium]